LAVLAELERERVRAAMVARAREQGGALAEALGLPAGVTVVFDERPLLRMAQRERWT